VPLSARPNLSRRTFNRALAATAMGGALQTACTSAADDYTDLVATTWRHEPPAGGSAADTHKQLVRYATLAASSHNTQPWIFELGADTIAIRPDLTRRCPAVDPDDHHLYASLGCATENLALAAAARGLHANVDVVTVPDIAIRIGFEPASPIATTQFDAIPQRQSTRAEYDGPTVPAAQIAQLAAAAAAENVEVRTFTGRGDLERILEYVVAGNTTQMNDRAFMDELVAWLRFNERAATTHRDGLFSASTGNPTLPSWLGPIMLRLAFTAEGENDKYAAQMRGSAGAIAFVSAHDDAAGWIDAGRSCQRFALQATAFGLKCAFINQPVEVPEVRAQFAAFLGTADRRADLLMRFGHGPDMPRSLRRPVEDVIRAG
jgi:nitroreductase